jgi:hypothetical protein
MLVSRLGTLAQVGHRLGQRRNLGFELATLRLVQ